jgi:hypothetical protein
MDALRYSKKIITLLTVTVLFLFTFFNLILDAPRRSMQAEVDECREVYFFSTNKHYYYEIWIRGKAEFICLNTLKRAPQGKGRNENMQRKACKRGKKEGEGSKRKA